MILVSLPVSVGNFIKCKCERKEYSLSSIHFKPKVFSGVVELLQLQSGASSLAKHGGAYISAFLGLSMIQLLLQDLGPYDPQEF